MSNELGNTPADKDYKPSGISKAQEAALKAYPEQDMLRSPNTHKSQLNKERRRIYRQGYKQAEKDSALTWEDMKRISRILDIMVDDDFEGKIPEEWGEEEYYEEVLRRFNKAKEAKQ